MPTLETIEVPIEAPKPKQSKQAGKGSRKAPHVTPPTEPKEMTQPKKSKQLGLTAFFGKVTKPKSPVHKTPTLDPARRSSLVNIVVGRTTNIGNKPDDPTKRLDFDKKTQAAEPPPVACTASPSNKKQKLDQAASDENHTIGNSSQPPVTAQTHSTPLVVEKSQTLDPGSPGLSSPAHTPSADKNIATDAAEDLHGLDSDSADSVEPSSRSHSSGPSEGADKITAIEKAEAQSKITSFPIKSSPAEKKSPEPAKMDDKTTSSQFYSVGDRVEVLWTLESQNEEGKVEKRWWGATVHEDKGETMVLEYDPYPEGGFDEVSRERVTFTSDHKLLSNGVAMQVRPEGEKRTNNKELDQDDAIESGKRHTMLRKYTDRAKELFTVFKESLTSEPPLDIVSPVETEFSDGESGGFPDFAIKTLNALIEGRSEPLSVLARIASEQLNATYNTEFSFEATSSKIKVIATRKNVLKDASVVTGDVVGTPVDSFEDESPFWRWEVTVVDLLPTDSLSRVKKARASHKKMSSHWNAIVKLVKALQNRSLNDKAWIKISQDEEKFLKHEREEEKARLAVQAKLSKLQEREKEKLMKQDQLVSQKKAQDEENARLKEEKMLLKQEAAAEKQRKKEETEKIRLQKQAEKEIAEREKLRKQQLLAKQQSRLMSIFVFKKKETTSDLEKVTDSPIKGTGTAMQGAGFDADAFRAEIAAGLDTSLNNPFKKVSKKARLDRKSQTGRVTISVDVTVFPDDPFASDPYAERRDVEVLNRYKFFLFHEDIRPPYYGTWSKPSKIVTGRTPFKQDTDFLDYEYDSEAEWEEGDDEIGIELDDDAFDDDDERDEDNDAEDEDGWLAADDEIPDDLDEETKERLRKQYETKKREVTGELTVCIIAPMHGKPVDFDRYGKLHSKVEGFSLADAKEVMNTHIAETTEQNIELCLDPFPPSLVDEPASEGLGSEGNQAKEPSLEDQKTFVQFVHNSTLGSKDKLIDELRSLHPQVTSSRAQAFRMLSTVAEKIKSASGASCWRVKSSVLSELDLAHLADTKVASESQEKILMKLVARSIHHETFASKEKAVDELRLKSEVLKATSRAECLRILDAVATKKKSSGNGVYWVVNDNIQSKLDLTDLPKDASVGNESPGSKSRKEDNIPIQVQVTEDNQKMSPSVKPTFSEGATSSSAQKKRKASSIAGSTKIMESFLKKAKKS